MAQYVHLLWKRVKLFFYQNRNQFYSNGYLNLTNLWRWRHHSYTCVKWRVNVIHKMQVFDNNYNFFIKSAVFNMLYAICDEYHTYVTLSSNHDLLIMEDTSMVEKHPHFPAPNSHQCKTFHKSLNEMLLFNQWLSSIFLCSQCRQLFSVSKVAAWYGLSGLRW